MRILLLGLGNPLLTDDGVGLRVAEELKRRLDKPEVTVESCSLAGLDLLELLSSYDKAIIIDAIQTEAGKTGQIYRLEAGDFSSTQHAATPHDVNFATALELGKRLGLSLPREILIFAIEVADVSTFGEECTTEVEKSLPVCIEMLIQELKGDGNA